MRAALNNGLSMPVIGFGTWNIDVAVARSAVKSAIEVGYRHIDAAWCYRNQQQVGEGIKDAIDAGIVTREDLWITSKLWNNFHASGDVEPHCRETLAQLGLTYVDLYLIHWPVTGNNTPELSPSTEETWRAMEALVAKGLVRTIGVSNFSVTKLQAMRSYAHTFPAVNQVESHPIWRQDSLIEGCKELGVHVTAYSPLGSPDSEAMIKHSGSLVMKHPTVHAIAAAVGKSPAQVCLRWGVQRGTSIVPKSVHEERMRENLDIFSWSLTEDQMTDLNCLEPQTRMLHGCFWLSEAGPYKTLEELWD